MVVVAVVNLLEQTGSLGDISGNRVVKGMTMPGHLGSEKTTVQNLEIVKVDVANNILLVKGSIPGAKKSFVIIKQAVKGLPTKEAIKLVDVKEVVKMNEPYWKSKKIQYWSYSWYDFSWIRTSNS